MTDTHRHHQPAHAGHGQPLEADPDPDAWKRDNIRRAVDKHLRKVTPRAAQRMSGSTARQQRADALAAAQGPDEIPGADDPAAWRGRD